MKYKLSFLLPAFIICWATSFAQMNKDYVPCNDMPNIMQNYYADVTALNRIYIVDGSPEKRERYKQLAANYINKLAKIDFNSLTQGCKADYILFKRDLDETVYQANKEAKERRGETLRKLPQRQSCIEHLAACAIPLLKSLPSSLARESWRSQGDCVNGMSLTLSSDHQ